MAETAKILFHAAEGFSAIQRLVEVSEGTVPPASRREMQEEVKEKARQARISLNGKAHRDLTMQEEESRSVGQLIDILDHIDQAEAPDAPEDAPVEEETAVE